METQEIFNNAEEQSVQAEATEAEEQEAISRHWKDRVKAWFTVKRIVLLSVALVLLIAAVAAFSWYENNWGTPIWNLEKQLNKTAYYPEEFVQRNLNGLAKKEMKTYFRILKKSEAYCDLREEFYENVEVTAENQRIQFGEDYRTELQIDDRIELSKSELKEIRAEWQEVLNDLADLLDEVEEEWESSDWRDFANACDMEVKDARKLIKSCRKVCESFGRVKIADGYEVEITRITTGEEWEDPFEYETTITVVKVNGRWVTADVADLLCYFDIYELAEELMDSFSAVPAAAPPAAPAAD